jgi:hypothetical protein
VGAAPGALAAGHAHRAVHHGVVRAVAELHDDLARPVGQGGLGGQRQGSHLQLFAGAHRRQRQGGRQHHHHRQDGQHRLHEFHAGSLAD